jgi:hypothetical protein
MENLICSKLPHCLCYGCVTPVRGLLPSHNLKNKLKQRLCDMLAFTVAFIMICFFFFLVYCLATVITSSNHKLF